jgi:hypothetical protein
LPFSLTKDYALLVGHLLSCLSYTFCLLSMKGKTFHMSRQVRFQEKHAMPWAEISKRTNHGWLPLKIKTQNLFYCDTCLDFNPVRSEEFLLSSDQYKNKMKWQLPSNYYSELLYEEWELLSQSYPKYINKLYWLSRIARKSK